MGAIGGRLGRQAAGRNAIADAAAVARDAVTGATPPGVTGVHVQVQAPDGEVLAGVDSAVLGRIIAPLAENACRHATSEVSVRVSRAAGKVRIVVQDDGPGVPQDEREAIFEPGARGTGATGDGAGLGLALSRRLARAAGGDVRAIAGSGGCFEVTVPGA